MKSRWVDLLVVAYAVLLFASGIKGFLEHNTLGLVTRCASAVIVLGLLAFKNVNPRVSRISTAVFALLLGGHTAFEFATKHKTTSLVLAIASFAVVGGLMAGHMAAMKERRAREAGV